MDESIINSIVLFIMGVFAVLVLFFVSAKRTP